MAEGFLFTSVGVSGWGGAFLVSVVTEGLEVTILATVVVSGQYCRRVPKALTVVGMWPLGVAIVVTLLDLYSPNSRARRS